MDQHAIVSETDLQGRVLRLNERFTHVRGYAQDELLCLDHRLLNSGHHPSESLGAGPGGAGWTGSRP